MVRTIGAAHKVTTGLVLCFNAVCKSFGDLRANDNISFTVKSGVMVGRSGLLMAGLLQPSKSVVKYEFYTSAIPVSTSPFDSGMTQVNARPMR